MATERKSNAMGGELEEESKALLDAAIHGARDRWNRRLIDQESRCPTLSAATQASPIRES